MTEHGQSTSELSQCRWCEAPTGTEHFRDAAAVARFQTSGLCQACQDQTYFAADRGDPTRCHRLRRGVVAAARAANDALEEVVFLPFVCVVPERRVAWDLNRLVRAGSVLEPPCRNADLMPMASKWGQHVVRLHQCRDLGEEEVRSTLWRIDLVVTIDMATMVTVKRHCAIWPGALLVALAEMFPWRAACGLSPLASFDLIRLHSLELHDALLPWPPGALNECALIAAFLESETIYAPYAPRTGFEVVLAQHASRFEEGAMATLAPATEGDAVQAGDQADRVVQDAS